MPKRPAKRCIDDIFDGIEAFVSKRKEPVIIEHPEIQHSSSDNPWQEGAQEDDGEATAVYDRQRKKPRKETRNPLSSASTHYSSSPTFNMSSSPLTSEGSQEIFATELFVRERGSDDVVDMAMYCASLLRRPTASVAVFRELLDHLSAHPDVIQMIRLQGHLQTFVESLVASRVASMPRFALTYTTFLGWLLCRVPVELALNATVFNALLGIVSPPTAMSNQQAAAKESHWSCTRKKEHPSPRANSGSFPTAEEKELIRKVKVLASLGDDEDCAPPQITAIEILTSLLLERNRLSCESSQVISRTKSFEISEKSNGLSPPPVICVAPSGAQLFYQARGFHVSVELLRSSDLHPALLVPLLRLLEVALCDNELVKVAQGTTVFEALFFAIFRILAAFSASSNTQNGAPTETVLMAIRTAINLTSLFPCVVPVDAERSASLGSVMASVLLSETIDSDMGSCALCLCANLLQRGKNNELRWALLKNEMLVCMLVSELEALRTRDDVEGNVCASYVALVLAELSIADSNARVAIITALSKMKDIPQERPMKLVVAILQEFLLFQSSAHLLTKSTLIELHEVIAQIIEENKIEASPMQP